MTGKHHVTYGSLLTSEDEEKAQREPLQPTQTHHNDDHDDDHDDDHGFFTTAFANSVRFSQRFSEQLHDGFTPLYRTVSEGVQTLAHPSFVLSEKALDLDEDRRRNFRSAGTSSIPSEVANLSKNTIGGGVMSLSGGIALFASDPSAVFSASGWIIGLGILFGYFCLL